MALHGSLIDYNVALFRQAVLDILSVE